MKDKHVPRSLDGYIIAFVRESLDDRDVCIYGDPEGLRSLGEAIIAVANLDQKHLSDQECPAEGSFHQHYATGLKIAAHERERKRGRQVTPHPAAVSKTSPCSISA